jgi:hypothetical protein
MTRGNGCRYYRKKNRSEQDWCDVAWVWRGKKGLRLGGFDHQADRTVVRAHHILKDVGTYELWLQGL